MLNLMKTMTALFAPILLAGVVAAGCATPNANPLHADKQMLQFIQDGKTSKETVLLKLGQPSMVLEGEKFLTYRLGYDEKHGYYLLDKAPVGWMGVKYNLVLVFDSSGVVQRRSLVEIH